MKVQSMENEKEIELMNKISTQAIIHGGDSGGAYCANEEKLTAAVNEWLELKGFDDKFFVDVTENADYYGEEITEFIKAKDYNLSELLI